MESEDEPSRSRVEILNQYLYNNTTATDTLQVRESSIPNAGVGLFTTKDIGEGEDLFRSLPLATCVEGEVRSSVCDFCFMDSKSKVHPTGRFKTAEDQVQDPMACSGCKYCRYCSRLCQRNAWRAYHKYECSTLAKGPEAFPSTRILYRIVAQQAHQLLSPEQWEALIALNPMMSNHLRGPHAITICDVGLQAKMLFVESDAEVSDMVALYCAILTNAMSVREAGGGYSTGMAIDIPMSTINHSCDPNTVVVFKGKELRVHSLRPIKAGEEILHCYADVTADVLQRQPNLKETYSIDCECTRCVEELQSHNDRCNNDQAAIERVREIQQKMYDLGSDDKANKADDPASWNIEGLEVRLGDLANQALPHSRWPNTLEPLPSMWKMLGAMKTSDYMNSVKYSVKGCAYTQRKRGPAWAKILMTLVQALARVAILPPYHPAFQDRTFLARGEAWNAYEGYLGFLLPAAEKAYGKDMLWCRAIRKWHDDVVRDAENPRPGTAAFKKRFRTAHMKLLAFAGVEKGQWDLV